MAEKVAGSSPASSFANQCSGGVEEVGVDFLLVVGIVSALSGKFKNNNSRLACGL
jgi:hypothetical protein